MRMCKLLKVHRLHVLRSVRNRTSVERCQNQSAEPESRRPGREVPRPENGFSIMNSGPGAHEFLRHNPTPVCRPGP